MSVTPKERKGSSTKILQFGEVLFTDSGLTFFSAKLSSEKESQVAVVMDKVVLGNTENDISKVITSYVDFVNSYADINQKIAKISEVGITPDLKPFLVADLDNIIPVEEIIFENEEKLMLYFKDVYSILLTLGRKSDYKMDLGPYTVFGQEGQIAFPGIYSLARKLSGGTDISGTDLLNDVSEYCQDIIDNHNKNSLFSLPNSGALTSGKSKEEVRRKIKFCLSTGNTNGRSSLINAFTRFAPEGSAKVFYLFKQTFKNLNFNIFKYIISFILPKNLFFISIIALVTGFAVILFLSTSNKKLLENISENTVPITEKPIHEEIIRVEENKSSPIVNDLTAIQQLEALQALNIISTQEDRRRLLSLFSASDFEIRIAALKLVAEKVEKGHPEVVSSLSELLLDPDYLVRGFAVSSLVAYSGEQARILLEDHQKSEASEVVKSAIDRALLKINTTK